MKLGIIINELFRGLLHNIEANKRALKKELQSRLSSIYEKILSVYSITVLDFVELIATVFHSHSRRNNKNISNRAALNSKSRSWDDGATTWERMSWTSSARNAKETVTCPVTVAAVKGWLINHKRRWTPRHWQEDRRLASVLSIGPPLLAVIWPNHCYYRTARQMSLGVISHNNFPITCPGGVRGERAAALR